MELTGLRLRMEGRLTLLATRIADLRQKMRHASGAERLAQVAEIGELDGRYKALNDRIRHIDPQGTGAISTVAAEMDCMVDDLADVVDDLIMRIDAGYRTDPARKG
ncbi:MAG: hypothetical protein WCC64_16505 [Aliidongia sp.]